MIRTGVDSFDSLARDSPAELQAFLARVSDGGWIVKPTRKLPGGIVAQFFPRKGRFYYDPDRMSMLDMWHEAKHLELFVQRGNWRTGAGQVWRDEIEVYTYEYRLGMQHGFSREYMAYLDRQIAFYRRRLDGPEAPRPPRMPDPYMKRADPPA